MGFNVGFLVGIFIGAEVGLFVGAGVGWLPLAVQFTLGKRFYNSMEATINSMDLFRNKIGDIQVSCQYILKISSNLEKVTISTHEIL